MKKKGCSALLIAGLLFSNLINAQDMKDNIEISSSAKFEPEDGKCLLFVGQNMDAIGGLEDYSDGYCDHFEMPAGITLYTNFSPGVNSYGHINKGNDGVKTIDNWGAGDSCLQCYMGIPDFSHSLIAIGLAFVDHEKQLARGDHDNLIRDLANWIKSLGKRPVFLRLGYEFDGWDWNHYKRKHYLAAWQRIRRIFEELEVENVAFVWQSKGWGSDQKILEEWYPGDKLVDWCGYSYFGNPDIEMLVFARKHGKPVFIAEATPVTQNGDLYFNTDLKDPKVAERVWKDWFIPFFRTVHNYQDVIKAISYINEDWPAQPMWINNPTFQQVDSRIQVSPYITEKWLEELANPRYINPGPDLWKQLWSE